MNLRILLLLPVIALLSLACDSDTSAPAQATQAPGAVASPPQDRLPSAEGTATFKSVAGTAAVHVKANPDPARGIAILEDVRVGSHPEGPGWDRIVFEFRNALPQADIEVATRPLSQCGSGMPVALRGSSVITIRFQSAQAHDDAGKLTIDATQLAGAGKSVLESKQACDFEGVVQWGLGVNGAQPFQVTSLTNPPRLVVDVSH